MLRPFFLIFIPFFFYSCTSKKILTTGNVKVSNIATLQKALSSDNFDYNWVDTKTKFSYEDNEQRLSGSAYIRMRKDSLIWLSISPGLGFEVARVQITNDSIIIINRLKREFQSYPFSYLNRYLGLDTLSIGMIQNILTGHPIFPIDQTYDFYIQENRIKLVKDANGVKEEMLLLPEVLRMIHYEITRTQPKQKVTFLYSDYQKIADKPFPIELNLEAVEKDKLSISLNFSKVTFKNQETVNFTIPTGYEKVD